jgi:hypothetical protein
MDFSIEDLTNNIEIDDYSRMELLQFEPWRQSVTDNELKQNIIRNASPNSLWLKKLFDEIQRQVGDTIVVWDWIDPYIMDIRDALLRGNGTITVSTNELENEKIVTITDSETFEIELVI